MLTMGFLSFMKQIFRPSGEDEGQETAGGLREEARGGGEDKEGGVVKKKIDD